MKALFILALGLSNWQAPLEISENDYFYFGNTNLVGIGQLENGKKNGDWNVYKRIEESTVPLESMQAASASEVEASFDLSNIVFRMSFKNDLPDGLMEELYPDGKIKKLVNFAEGKLHGDFFEFSDQGEVFRSGSYFQDKKVEGWKSFYPDGSIQSEFFYENGLLSGNTKNYHSDGSIAETISLESGKLEGSYQSFYRNGSIQKEVQFSDGLEHGDFKLYFEDGKICASGQFEKGILTGNWEFFNADGFLLSTGTYRAGQKNGIWKEKFDEVPEFYRTGEFNDGLKTGLWKVIDFDGIVYQEETYFEDELIATGGFKTTSGDMLAAGTIKNGKGRRVIFDSEGNTLERGRYTKGKRTGLWYHYFPKTESVAKVGSYLQGNKIGIWKYYDFAGQLVSEEDFSKDENSETREASTFENHLKGREDFGRNLVKEPTRSNDLEFIQRFNFNILNSEGNF
jgi:antitoxin component YwqK of YwqJK toxin-antitoxin module